MVFHGDSKTIVDYRQNVNKHVYTIGNVKIDAIF